MPVVKSCGLSYTPIGTTSPCSRHLVHTALLVLTAVSIGCDQPAGDPEPESATAVASQGETADAAAILGPVRTALKPAADAKTELETWDAIFMGGTKVGSIHTVFKHFPRDGQIMVHAVSTSLLEIRRFGQTASMQTKVTSLESREGMVRAFSTETTIGPTPVVTQGIYRDGAMQLVTTSQGKMMRSHIPWDDANGGFFALEQSLSRNPLKPGQTRGLTMLIPDVAGIQVVKADLSAQALEPVELLEGTRQLLRIDMVTQIGSLSLDSSCWTTPEGDVLKTSIPALQQITYRTSQSRAQERGTGDFDLGWGSIVKIANPLPDPLGMTRAEYQVSLAKKNPAEVFASGCSQRVEAIDARKARIIVLAVRPGSPVEGAKAQAPDSDALQPNSLIQSDDAQVVAMAEKIAGGAPDDWTRCVALEQGVHQSITSKHFGQAFATAADVARTLEGDCTEHAVLLAALCRAQGIPARVVLGLVYSRRDQGFAFHMWNEAWVKDRWIPLDATLGQGGIGAAYLKLAHTSLAQGAAEAASVLQVINQLKIEVLDYQPR